jgi:putative oxidoreductase
MMIAVGLLLLHLVLGLIFLGHGSQKLFGLFGGKGLAGTTQMMNSLGLCPARWWALVAALGEFLGGLLLALGLLTRIGAPLIIGVMLVAIGKVHWSKGFWNSQGGIEFP